MKIIIILLFGFLCFFQTACEQKSKAPSKEEIIQQGYKKFLAKKWIDLNTNDEWILKTCLEKDSEGGAEIQALRYQDKAANKLVSEKLLQWDSDNRKYKLTKMGKDAYALGMEMQEEELKKDPRMRSGRVSKN